MLEKLAERVRGRIGVAHEESPCRPQLGVDVRARRDIVVAQARHERIDAVVSARIVRTFGFGRDKSRVIDQEIHVGIALRDAADIDAGRMLVRLRSERQPFMHRDVANAELARLLDQRDPRIVVEKEAFARRSPLRIRFPRGDLVALGKRIHAFQVALLVRIHASVQQHAMRTLRFLDDARGLGRLLDRQRLALAGRRHERQHDQVGVRIEKDILDEFVRTQALQIAQARARGLRDAAIVVSEHLERLRAGRQRARPRTGRIHEVTLHVENEFVAVERRARCINIQRRFARKLIEAASAVGRGVGGVHAEQRRRGAAGGHQKRAAREPQALGVGSRRVEREAPRTVMHRLERNRLELAVGSGVQLDRQSASRGIVAIAHGMAPRATTRLERTRVHSILEAGTDDVQPRSPQDFPEASSRRCLKAVLASARIKLHIAGARTEEI